MGGAGGVVRVDLPRPSASAGVVVAAVHWPVVRVGRVRHVVGVGRVAAVTRVRVLGGNGVAARVLAGVATRLVVAWLLGHSGLLEERVERERWLKERGGGGRGKLQVFEVLEESTGGVSKLRGLEIYNLYPAEPHFWWALGEEGNDAGLVLPT